MSGLALFTIIAIIGIAVLVLGGKIFKSHRLIWIIPRAILLAIKFGFRAVRFPRGNNLATKIHHSENEG